MTRVEKGVAEQIFVVSAAMVGVCLTLMGIVGIISSLHQVATLTDELLAGDAMVFLAAYLSTYFALRTRSAAAAHRTSVRLTSRSLSQWLPLWPGAIVALRLI